MQKALRAPDVYISSLSVRVSENFKDEEQVRDDGTRWHLGDPKVEALVGGFVDNGTHCIKEYILSIKFEPKHN